jgi:hypothetical protein
MDSRALVEVHRNMETNRLLIDINDKMDTLQTRMDRFFEWAGVIQREYRNLQNRLTFIESQCLDRAQFHPSTCLDEEQRLKVRLEAVKGFKG